MKEDFSSTAVIILAAGDSERMGIPKGLLDYRGKPFLSHQIYCIKQIGISDIIIVLGRDIQIYLNKINNLEQYNIVLNPQPDYGPFSSIQLGLSVIYRKSYTGAYILPIDVPCPDFAVWESLLKETQTEEINIVIPSFAGKKGHPVLISKKFMEYILNCNINSRLDHEIYKQLDNEKAKIISVDDSTILLNLNTLDDWKRFEETK